ncbi:COG1470 family protein [Cellulomonas phragmiteti]|uniref:DUF916 domain-containing protein n=1 Tax=Cellulomonas phragmiteti TaxID=478780 RepID=A0ABQ4DQZ2_9CELL|nr:hypothetical protein [Cellulomonas phragmiteti]GIG41758.1 hypothetical protein Cph01nite_35200 [Cellulomonas phragmiteti]
MRTLLRPTLAAAVVALAASLVAAPVATGAPPAAAAVDDAPGTTVTWTVQPATADGPDGRLSLRHVIDPGASVTDHVTVSNLGDGPATFAVYAGDGIVSDAGYFDLPPAGPPQDGGAWVALDPPAGAETLDDGRLRLTLEAGAAVTVPLTITVPADATPGDHPAGVVAELVAGDTVRLAARTGVRLHLRVAGEVTAALVPEQVTARWEPSWNPFAPGTVHVRYVVRNAGDVRLGARAATTLAGPAGLAAAAHTAELREVLPGQSATVEATLPVWPLGRASGHVDVRPWVVGEDVVDAAMRTASADVAVWTVPWSQLGLLLVLAAGVVLTRWLRRRSARGVQERIDAALAAAGVPREPSDATGARAPVR